jgi:hypothetical protein
LLSGWDSCQKLRHHDKECVLGPCGIAFFDWLGKQPLVMWTLILAFGICNAWFDYYKSGWAIVDGVVLAIGVAAYLFG